MVLSRTPLDSLISGVKDEIRRTAWMKKKYWVLKIGATIARAWVDLKKSQIRYKKKLNRRMRRVNGGIEEGHFVRMDMQDGMSK